MSACAPKGRGQHFYSFQVEVELRSERGGRIDLDESHPRLDFPSHLLPPHSAAERITNFVMAQLEWLQGEGGERRAVPPLPPGRSKQCYSSGEPKT